MHISFNARCQKLGQTFVACGTTFGFVLRVHLVEIVLTLAVALGLFSQRHKHLSQAL